MSGDVYQNICVFEYFSIFSSWLWVVFYHVCKGTKLCSANDPQTHTDIFSLILLSEKGKTIFLILVAKYRQYNLYCR